MALRTLVYGFGPYQEFERNISEEIVRALQPSPALVTEVFETAFDRGMFEHALVRHSPDIIIGVGQHRRARKLRLERRAVNRWGERETQLKSISSAGPPRRLANLRLPVTAETTVAYDAGVYVCNFSMYLCLEYCAARGARFGFIHVPTDYDVSSALGYLSEAVAAARADLC